MDFILDSRSGTLLGRLPGWHRFCVDLTWGSTSQKHPWTTEHLFSNWKSSTTVWCQRSNSGAEPQLAKSFITQLQRVKTLTIAFKKLRYAQSYHKCIQRLYYTVYCMLLLFLRDEMGCINAGFAKHRIKFLSDSSANATPWKKRLLKSTLNMWKRTADRCSRWNGRNTSTTSAKITYVLTLVTLSLGNMLDVTLIGRNDT